MVKSYQRLALIALVAVCVLLTGIMFGVPEQNPSQALSALSDNGSEMQIPYYTNTDHLPSATQPSEMYTVVLFTASWDSYSVRLSEILKGRLAVYNNLQIVQLEISEFRAVAQQYEVTQPPMVILLDKQGSEVARTSSAVSGEVDRLLNQISK